MSHSLPKAYRSAIDLAGKTSKAGRQKIDIGAPNGLNALSPQIPLDAARFVILLFRYFEKVSHCEKIFQTVERLYFSRASRGHCNHRNFGWVIAPRGSGGEGGCTSDAV